MPLLVPDAPGVSRITSEKSAVGGTEFSMIDRLTIACGSKVWTDAVIGVSWFTRVAVTTMSSLLRRLASGVAATSAACPDAASNSPSAALANSIVFVVIAGPRICRAPPSCTARLSGVDDSFATLS